MIPLVDYERELRLMRELVVADRARRRACARASDYTVGTMIELPRACLIAEQLAHHADFFSFGTNDLTQTALGFSRDDIEGRILAALRRASTSSTSRRSRRSTATASASSCGSPSRAAARPSPGSTSASAASTAATPTRSSSSHEVGLDYVSCSPFRVPIARVAAAQAAIATRVSERRSRAAPPATKGRKARGHRACPPASRATLAGGARDRALLPGRVRAARRRAGIERIEQGYLAIDRDGTEVRIRRRGGRHLLTVKSGDAGAVRVEEEFEIEAAASRLWPLTAGRRLEKDRHLIELPGRLPAELDVYGGELAGLRVVEVEFDSTDQADCFAAPAGSAAR